MTQSYTWTYTITNAVSGSGTVTVTTGPATNGVYTAQSISGTFDGSAVTGLNTVFTGPDNIFSLTQPGFGDGIDSNGVSFNLANNRQVNFFYDGAQFEYSDSSGQATNMPTTPVFTTTACYVRGTLIATPTGERLVQDLAMADLVLTASGPSRPVKWIGRRAYAGPFLAANPQVQPIRLLAGSLGDGLPRRDLLISPEHAMAIDGMLVPARCLVNGDTIRPDPALTQVEYFHIELDSHDVILAEGAPSETFVDDNSRGMFHNAHEYGVLYPGAEPRPARFCLPRLEEGPALDALRRRLSRVAEAAGLLQGRLDTACRERITGWARNTLAPDPKVRLLVRDNGAILGEVVAEAFRADLAEAGVGDGQYAFTFEVPGGLSPALRHVIAVERASDGAELPGGPLVLDEQMAAELIAVPAWKSTALRGSLDVCTRHRIAGWAYLPGRDGPVALQVLDNGVPVAQVLANQLRPDLVGAGFGTGRHGFDLFLPGGLPALTRHVIEIRSEGDGARLPGTPAVIEPADAFDTGLEGVITAAVAALAPGDRQDHVLGFLRRQAERLQQDRADGDADRVGRVAADRRRRRWGSEPSHAGKRALVVDAHLPQAGHSGGDNALLSHMAALQQLGYAVSFVAAEEMAAGAPLGAGDDITVLGLPFYASVEEVLRRQADCFDVVYLHRVEMAACYLPLVRQHAPRARVLYSVADLHHVRLVRQAAVQDEPALLATSRSVWALERTAAATADAVLTHSREEAALLRRLVPSARVHCVPWAMQAQSVRPAFYERSGVAFIGYFAHEPNVDAAVWLAEVVMPLVWQRRPGLECVIAGRAMPSRVQRLAQPGVVVLGAVADLRAVYDRVRLTAATLRFGAGVKSKVLESFAAGLPCVMTPMAAEGIELSPALRALVGSSPEDLADRIVRLHEDAADNHAAAADGVEMIRSHHNEQVVAEAVERAIAVGAIALQRAG